MQCELGELTPGWKIVGGASWPWVQPGLEPKGLGSSLHSPHHRLLGLPHSMVAGSPGQASQEKDMEVSNIFMI